MARIAHQAGADGVPEDVEDGAAELPIITDRLRSEAALEKVSDTAVAQVVALGVPAVQELDAAREAGLADLEDQVDVVRHLDGAVDAPAVAPRGYAQKPRVRLMVLRVVEETAAVDPAGVDVVVAVRELGSKRPRHR